MQGKMIGTVQRQEIPEEEEPLQGKMADTVQCQEIPEEEEPLQTKRENNTGMPDNLKAGVENLSGIDMSDVKVHYSSSKPADVGALAYTQGTDIHIASGQEKHLPHEVWHVVQQAQGRVRPTMQLKEGVPVNDDEGLEQEADVMGARAMANTARFLGSPEEQELLQGKSAPIKLTEPKYEELQLNNCSKIPTRSDTNNVSRHLEVEVNPRGELTACMQLTAKVASSTPVQRIASAPAITNTAILAAGPNNLANTDTVTIGPTNVSAYTANIANAVPDRNAAIVEVRTQYRSIGSGFRGLFNGRFLSEPALHNLCDNQRPVAAHVYDSLVQNGGIPGGIPAPVTPQQKQAHLTNLGLVNVLTPANLEFLRNDDLIPLNDPVKVTINSIYGMNGADRLDLTVDFTEGQKGYVCTVVDTASGTNSRIMDRPNYAGEYPVPETRDFRGTSYRNWVARDYLREKGIEQANAVATFSNVHHTATDAAAGVQIGFLGQHTTKENLEGGVDAITKLVAEGGRFECVEGLGTAICNNSIFYVPHNREFRCIEFRSLWKLWQRQFGGIYGVTNIAVAGYLTGPLRVNHGMTQTHVEPPQTGHNYNVATGTIR